MATMEPKVICVLLVIFSLAFSSLAQVQTGKHPSSCFLVGNWAQRGSPDGGLCCTVCGFEPSIVLGS